MKARFIALAALALAACGSAFAQGGEMAEVTELVEQLSALEPRELKEPEVQSFIATVTEVQSKDLKLAGFGGGDDNDFNLTKLEASIDDTPAVKSIVRSNGFSTPEFTEVTGQIGLAMMRAEMQREGADLMQMATMMEMMIPTMPDGPQKAEAVAGIQALKDLDKIAKSAPEGNVQLVEKYRTELEALD
ncbi:MAG: hypothetical protein AAFZ58_08740 [Pseudomonadota bacterium]